MNREEIKNAMKWANSNDDFDGYLLFAGSVVEDMARMLLEIHEECDKELLNDSTHGLFVFTREVKRILGR